MIKKFIKYLTDKRFIKIFLSKIVYPLKKHRLELILKYYEGKCDRESINKWYEAKVDWCALTKSSDLIYNTSVREKN